MHYHYAEIVLALTQADNDNQLMPNAGRSFSRLSAEAPELTG
jgi:hypothetical protein